MADTKPEGRHVRALPLAWRELVEQVNERTTFGQRGVRDPDNPCDAFVPGDPEPNGDCATDGHYMCDECTERKTCECGCGERPMDCEGEDGPYHEYAAHRQRKAREAEAKEWDDEAQLLGQADSATETR